MLSRVLKLNVLLLLIAISSIALVAPWRVRRQRSPKPQVPLRRLPTLRRRRRQPGRRPERRRLLLLRPSRRRHRRPQTPRRPRLLDAGPAVARQKIETRTGPTGVVLNLHEKQEITMVGPWGEVGYGNVPWRDGGGNSFFGKNVYGTLLGLNPDNR